MRLVAARSISRVVTAAMEVLYNRRRVALAQASNVSKEFIEDREFSRAFWNASLTQIPASDISAPGHRYVWPELRFKLWKLDRATVPSNGFLGEAVLVGGESGIF